MKQSPNWRRARNEREKKGPKFRSIDRHRRRRRGGDTGSGAEVTHKKIGAPSRQHINGRRQSPTNTADLQNNNAVQ